MRQFSFFLLRRGKRTDESHDGKWSSSSLLDLCNVKRAMCFFSKTPCHSKGYAYFFTPYPVIKTKVNVITNITITPAFHP